MGKQPAAACNTVHEPAMTLNSYADESATILKYYLPERWKVLRAS